MSYILDALRRSDRERRGLGNAPPARPLRYRSGHRYRLVVLAAVVLIATAIAAVYLSPSLMRAPETAPPTVDEAGGGKAEDHEETSVLAQLAGEADSSTQPGREPDTGANGNAQPDAGSQPDAQPPPTSDPQPQDRHEPDPEPERPPAPEQESDPGPVPEPAPAYASLPTAYRQSLPEFTINVHVYAAEPGRRFLLVDMRRYGEGETLAAGPRIERITPDGVVLAWRERQFHIPVGGGPRG
ncbi:general secretion pathway protein GspB [Arhodomonas sp. AD133]|uniref:general secretion pathway protein GspB n=1 Tax=Arhodomonas sp. AD133 TaxID=3415009 RepID=UPI003EBF04E0